MYSNRVMITGFLGKDAESRTTRNDSKFTTLSVATKRSWKNRETGEYESQTTWHRCVVYGPQASFAATLLKGAHLQIEGEIRSREYTEKARRQEIGRGEEDDHRNPRDAIVKLDRTKKESPTPKGPPHKRPLPKGGAL